MVRAGKVLPLRIVAGLALVAWALMGGPVWAWVGVVFLATGLIGYGMRDGIEFFRSPSQIALDPPRHGERFRLGGLVVDGSLVRGTGTEVRFTVTDGGDETDDHDGRANKPRSDPCGLQLHTRAPTRIPRRRPSTATRPSNSPSTTSRGGAYARWRMGCRRPVNTGYAGTDATKKAP